MDVTSNMRRLMETRSDYQLRKQEYDQILAGGELKNQTFVKLGGPGRARDMAVMFIPTYANAEEEITKIVPHSTPVQFWSDPSELA